MTPQIGGDAPKGVPHRGGLWAGIVAEHNGNEREAQDMAPAVDPDHNWWSALVRWRDASWPARLDERLARIAFAEEFVDGWADVATRHGWRPVHLLSRPGLVHRVPFGWYVRAFYGRAVVLAGDWHHWAYLPCSDGSVERMTGKARWSAIHGAGIPSRVTADA